MGRSQDLGVRIYGGRDESRIGGVIGTRMTRIFYKQEEDRIDMMGRSRDL